MGVTPSLEGLAVELAAVRGDCRALMDERVRALGLNEDDVRAVLQRTITILRVAATALKIKSDALRASDCCDFNNALLDWKNCSSDKVR